MTDVVASVASVADGTVSVSGLIALVTGILSIAAGGYAVLIRFSFDTYQKATEKRFADLEKANTDLKKASDDDEKELKKEVQNLTKQNHELEKTTIRLEGEVNLLGQNHGHSSTELDSIRENMVLRNEWEPRQKRVEEQMDAILKELRSGTGRYASSGSTPRFPVSHVEKKGTDR